MNIKPEFKQKPIRSFVLRTGRMTEGQQAAFSRHWPTLGVSLFDGELKPEKLFLRQQPLALEVGFGMGDSLIEMALAEPHINFIGIEVHPPGVGRLLNNAADAGLTNLRVFMADAKDVLEDCIADGTLARFQLYFPDPWHKKRHHKRRIVQPEFISLISRKLCHGGLLHMATDWQNYAEHMLEVLSAEPSLANTAPDYAPRPAFRPVTKFELRGERLGHGTWDLLFARR